jgi:hypothetical protein
LIFPLPANAVHSGSILNFDQVCHTNIHTVKVRFKSELLRPDIPVRFFFLNQVFLPERTGIAGYRKISKILLIIYRPSAACAFCVRVSASPKYTGIYLPGMMVLKGGHVPVRPAAARSDRLASWDVPKSALACPATTRARTAAGRTGRPLHACGHGYFGNLPISDNSVESAFVLDFALAVNR